jgi:hypothetical protein
MLIVAFAYFIDLPSQILENYLRPNQRNQFEPKKQKKVEANCKEINLLSQMQQPNG